MKTPGTSNALYEFGPYTLDVERRAFTRAGEPVPLAPKTFEALVFLVQSGGRALSKQELMAALWPDTFVEEANLSFQISLLRKALRPDGARWIETLPKHGYRFNGPVRAMATHTNQRPEREAAAPAGPARGGKWAGPRMWIAGLIVAITAAAGWAAIGKRSDHASSSRAACVGPWQRRSTLFALG